MTKAQRRVLEMLQEYGSGLDFGGRGANRSLQRAARQLIERGLARGDCRALWITNAGIAAIDGELTAPGGKE